MCTETSEIYLIGGDIAKRNGLDGRTRIHYDVFLVARRTIEGSFASTFVRSFLLTGCDVTLCTAERHGHVLREKSSDIDVES